MELKDQIIQGYLTQDCTNKKIKIIFFKPTHTFCGILRSRPKEDGRLRHVPVYKTVFPL